LSGAELARRTEGRAGGAASVSENGKLLCGRRSPADFLQLAAGACNLGCYLIGVSPHPHGTVQVPGFGALIEPSAVRTGLRAWGAG